MDLPFRILRPFLGARIIKTGLAVFLSLVSFHWFGSNYGTFSAVAAILAVQPSMSRARRIFWEQLTSNLIGGIVGAVLGYYFGSGSLVMALAVVLVLGLCVRFRLNETASTAVVAVLFIMDRPEHDFLFYTGARIMAVVGGMLIGHLVNRFVRPPKFTQRALEELNAASEGVSSFGGRLLTSLASPQHYRKEQIKQDAAEIKGHLESAGYLLELQRDFAQEAGSVLPMEKARASLYVFVERIMDIHKIILHMDGLHPGPELGAVANLIKAVLAYKSEVVNTVLKGRFSPAPEPAAAFAAAQTELSQLVQGLIASPGTRERGLALHSLLTNAGHMGWRMESLTRLLAQRSK
ncbi:MAG TPA: aromatic acid exporter family protein [Symbiobacteriaceae bacterium]|nr:aromatic acid exporter family protein [Symbiobacteriaceae bacterium]